MHYEVNRLNEEIILLSKGATAEIVEKKSRFIATIRPVATEEEANLFIDEIRKKYYDARHNCFAYLVGTDQNIAKSSDDGEPSGTAGRPMLEVLTGSGIKNIAVVVTRYFGGVLLGTGGLVRAYQLATKEALSLCETVLQKYGVKFTLKTDYNSIGKLQYLFSNNNVTTIDTLYEADVIYTAICPVENYSRLAKDITEITSGKALLKESERLYYI